MNLVEEGLYHEDPLYPFKNSDPSVILSRSFLVYITLTDFLKQESSFDQIVFLIIEPG